MEITYICCKMEPQRQKLFQTLEASLEKTRRLVSAYSAMKMFRIPTHVAAILLIVVLFDLLGGALCLQGRAEIMDFERIDASCPLNWTFTPPDYCLEGAAQTGLDTSVCCVEAITSFSQALALNCNKTNGEQLFLAHADEAACALQASRQNWTNSQTCFSSPAFTVSGNDSLCYFTKLTDLKTSLGDGSFDTVATLCRDVQPHSCPACLDAFKQAQSSLSVKHGGEVSSNVCWAAMLVAIASLDIGNSASTQALYECVKIAGVFNQTVADFPRQASPEPVLSVGLIVVATVATLVLLLFLGALLAMLRRSRSIPPGKFNLFTLQPFRKGQREQQKAGKQNDSTAKSGEPHADEASTKSGPPSSRPVLIHGSDSHSGLYSFSAKELMKATENFSEKNFLGEGSAGIVYRGVLPSGQLVAVKRINNEKKLDTFYKEVENLSRVRHPNLATLLGLCKTADEHLLVYEYCSKGNLSQLLFGDGPPLTWEQRISISVGAAKGIWFLHMYPGGYIVHRDIKPTNILLNEHMEAKVSDFGLSRFIAMDESYVVTEVRGTTGYMDPEYMNAGTLTFASDVYSLGVVMLQLISGRKPIFNFSLEGNHPYSLVKAAARALYDGNLDELVDPRLKGVYSVPAYQKMLEIAVACTRQTSHDRPTMSEVMDELDEAWGMALAYSPQRRASEDEESLITFSTDLNPAPEKDRKAKGPVR